MTDRPSDVATGQTVGVVNYKTGEVEQQPVYGRAFLEFVIKTGSQYDGTCRRMAAQILFAEERASTAEREAQRLLRQLSETQQALGMAQGETEGHQIARQRLEREVERLRAERALLVDIERRIREASHKPFGMGAALAKLDALRAPAQESKDPPDYILKPCPSGACIYRAGHSGECFNPVDVVPASAPDNTGGGAGERCDGSRWADPHTMQPPICAWQPQDDNGYPFGPICGKPATHVSCIPYWNTKTCAEHKCRCARPLQPPDLPSGAHAGSAQNVTPIELATARDDGPKNGQQGASASQGSAGGGDDGFLSQATELWLNQDNTDALWAVICYLQEKEKQDQPLTKRALCEALLDVAHEASQLTKAETLVRLAQRLESGRERA